MVNISEDQLRRAQKPSLNPRWQTGLLDKGTRVLILRHPMLRVCCGVIVRSCRDPRPQGLVRIALELRFDRALSTRRTAIHTMPLKKGNRK